MKMKVGLIGTRGMVGSVLLQRMLAEDDFAVIRPVFFSSSQAGLPVKGFSHLQYHDAYDLEHLADMDVLLSCQGSDYTAQVYDVLRQGGWQGYFIDAASYLRLRDESVICLDPVNCDLIKEAVRRGVKTFVGGNCTVSLMLMALSAVIKSGAVEWINAATYQAASGAGIQGVKALLREMQTLGNIAAECDNTGFLELDGQLNAWLHEDHTEQVMGGVLAGSLLPWIDSDLQNGISREEAKMQPEAAKILGEAAGFMPMDSLCIRVSAIRCHSQAITLKLRHDLSLEALAALIESANSWVKVIPNCKEDSLRELTPAHISGTLNIAVGRIRKLNLPGHYWSLFTVGDQLLWGAAEPLRRMLRFLQTQRFDS